MPAFIGTAIAAVGALLTGGTVAAGATGMAAIASVGMAGAIVGAAAIGAVVGGVVAAVKGESILKGALMGGLVGAAVGGGLGWAAQASAASAGAGTSIELTGAGVPTAEGAALAYGPGGAATIPVAETGGAVAGDVVLGAAGAEGGKDLTVAGLLAAQAEGQKAAAATAGKYALAGTALQSIGAGFMTPEEEQEDKTTTFRAGEGLEGKFVRKEDAPKFTINDILDKTPTSMYNTGNYSKPKQSMLAQNTPAPKPQPASTGTPKPQQQQSVLG